MSELSILVVDDEPPARGRLSALVGELDRGDVIGTAANGLDAIEFVEEHAPDVVLLDIRMPGMDGLETARHLAGLATPPAIVFTTAYDDHAVEAFEAHAIDYLLKPIRRERLDAALGRASELSWGRISRLQPAMPDARTHLSAVVGGHLRMVQVSDIRFFLAEQKYVTVGWSGGEMPLEDSLKSLEHEFEEGFFRIHRNALVSRAHVVQLEHGSDGNHFVSLQDIERKLLVSRRLLSTVRKVLR
jgi:two-component system response regulator AlgR